MIFRPRHLLLLLSVSAAAVAASRHPAPRAHDLDESYTFDQYLAHFDKAYTDPEEYARRSRTFADNLRTVLRHNEGKMNAAGDVSKGYYVMGVNALTDVSVDELPMGYNKALHPAWSSQLTGRASSTKRMLGASETRSYSVPPDFEMKEVSDLPDTVDWAAAGKVDPTVPMQGGCGSCWTFAATAAIESHLAIAQGDAPVVTLSEQTMLDCTPNPDQCGGTGECFGATVELGLNYIADLTASGAGGMYAIGDVPYTGSDGPSCEDLAAGKRAAVGIEGWTALPPNDYQATMNALQVGPVAVAVGAGNWVLYEKGIFNGTDATINHAVLLVGYGLDEETGEKFWKIRNSWGPTFGEEGYIRLKRTDDDGSLCVTDAEPLLGIACALDERGNTVDVAPVEVCGTSGVLFDVSYPKGVHSLD